ncbi:DUF2461 domain-containing protein [Pedobacter xixiisoli]|uniref:TIGR02453 family protein n=1 Tax=Pedobacter xixiisoli TaxID=1476464 RepID=A0A286AEZ5_9SPHI|nr:DUF2461 domain-containing protein [Pedobacter xixiisoli]SOD20461.1 TIGR02453 family protein [Pedobacter xixiisoli]
MLKKSTLNFLRELAENNNREWFAKNKHLYEDAKLDLFALTAPLIKELAAIDSEFSADTEPKKCLLRIYRDVRFSLNKDPYKKNYGIAFDVKGYGPTTPSYYLHLEPNNCFFGAGFWMPESKVVKSIREEIDYSGNEFLEAINGKDYKAIFSLSKDDTLKKAPKGYEMDHPMIEYLRLKSFIAIYPLKEEEFYKNDIVDKLTDAFKAVQPFITFLRKAVSQ